MTKKRYVSTCFWDDWYIVQLDPIEKLLFLYFMTNPLTKICGIYEISVRRISFDTWIDKDMVIKIINRFSKAKKIYYIDWWIYLKNFQKHQNLKNSKIQKWIETEMQLIPEEIKNKIWVIDESYMTYVWLSNNIDSDSDIDSDIDSDSDRKKKKKKKVFSIPSDLQSFVDSWNWVDELIQNRKLVKWLPKTNKITKDIQELWEKVIKEYTVDEIKESVNKYLISIENTIPNEKRDGTHRYTLYEFLTRKNWLQKFINS